MRRTAICISVLIATTIGLAGCGDNVKVNFDKNGKEKACKALSAVKTEVDEVASGSTTVGDAQTKLADIESKLTAATDTKTGFTKSVLAPLQKAIDAAKQKLSSTDASQPLSSVAGAADAESKVASAFKQLNSLFKCA